MTVAMSVCARDQITIAVWDDLTRRPRAGTITLAQRGAPAYVTTEHVSLSYRSSPDEPPDLRLIDAVVQIVRRLEPRLARLSAAQPTTPGT